MTLLDELPAVLAAQQVDAEEQVILDYWRGDWSLAVFWSFLEPERWKLYVGPSDLTIDDDHVVTRRRLFYGTEDEARAAGIIE